LRAGDQRNDQKKGGDNSPFTTVISGEYQEVINISGDNSPDTARSDQLGGVQGTNRGRFSVYTGAYKSGKKERESNYKTA